MSHTLNETELGIVLQYLGCRVRTFLQALQTNTVLPSEWANCVRREVVCTNVLAGCTAIGMRVQAPAALASLVEALALRQLNNNDLYIHLGLMHSLAP
ncbi:hypothetical protein PAXRUDRAFT_15310 [Paxillus rubicundulus Ve08.2h10]|uniref:Uncharacterized protein n=1 Tax=Paxillus rubicundulus Ve08.2h10 TaxID=930991 RepID=A0A0D0CEX8_9AGAM|nr:hypothetical protein PAXRUDRAFT_15310 [Paxillus rubicundulus Ve08.2h10]